jgi:hypothetical protein
VTAANRGDVHRPMRIFFAALALGLAALAYGVDPAAACSCALGDARTRLARADGAFVGTFVEKREPAQIESSADDAVYVFRVEQSVKGNLPETLFVLSPVSGASCGLEISPGDRVGLFLRRDGDSWRAVLCDQVAPSELLAAARPLPAPNGMGRLAFLVGGKLGGVRTFGLDAQGRTLAYGLGRGDTLLLSTCPGARRVVEYASGFTVNNARFLAVRELRSFRIVRERRYQTQRSGWVASLSCLSADGSRVAVFETGEVPMAPARVVVGGRVVWRGVAQAAAFSGRSVYLAAGPRATDLVRLDLGSGKVQRLAALPANTTSLRAGPGGKVAGVMYNAAAGRDAPPSRVVLFDPSSRVKVRSAPLSQAGVTGDVDWWRGRLVFLPDWGADAARVYDGRLRVVARFRGWIVDQSLVRGDRAYGLSRGLLVAAALPRGPVKVVRRFATPVTYALTVTPGASRVSGR